MRRSLALWMFKRALDLEPLILTGIERHVEARAVELVKTIIADNERAAYQAAYRQAVAEKAWRQ